MYFATMVDTLASTEDILLTGFGGFGLREKRERAARNPRAGEPATVDSRRHVQRDRPPGLSWSPRRCWWDQLMLVANAPQEVANVERAEMPAPRLTVSIAHA